MIDDVSLLVESPEILCEQDTSVVGRAQIAGIHGVLLGIKPGERAFFATLPSWPFRRFAGWRNRRKGALR